MPAHLPILTFHALDDGGSIVSFPPALFRRGMARLHERGYRTLGLLDLVEHVRQGRPFPERSFAITFDDGYQSVYDHAFPVLQRYGFSTTVFLTVGKTFGRTNGERLPSMCERSMLKCSEIREMHQSGVQFGSHTLTHPDLTRLSPAGIEAEVCDAKAIIEDALSAEVFCFAYPFGRYDERCRELVSRHFACACSDRLGFVRAGSDPYALERVDTYYLRSANLLAAVGTKFFALYVRARAVPRGLRRFVAARVER